MSPKTANTFLLLVLVQAMHSIEEYVGSLWDVFPLARWLTSLFSEDRHFAFVFINISLFLFGLCCYFFLIKKNHYLAKFIVWFWILLELTNGLIHSIWSVMEYSYTPGLITAPFIFLIALYLAKVILDQKKQKELN